MSYTQLPEYVPEQPLVRPFLFPVDLHLAQQDIADIVHCVLPADRTPPGFDTQTVIKEMCEVQSAGIVKDR